MTRTVLAAAAAAFALSACASAPPAPTQTAAAQPERRLERPAPGSNDPPPAPRAADPGEAALEETSPDAIEEGEDDLVVRGQTPDIEVTPPPGDPRTPAQRAADIRAWDRCVMRVQRQTADDAPPYRPVQSTPEEVCSERLGMAGRDAIPYRRQ